MTKASKVLTVFLLFASVAFMGFAAVSSATRSDAKQRVAVYPEKIAAQRKEIEELDPEITKVQARIKEAEVGIAADIAAMKKRESALEAQLQQLQVASTEVATQVVAEAKKAQGKRDEAKVRREDALRLRSELEVLRTQKSVAQAEQRRLQDELYQVEGTLELARHRTKLLISDGAKLPSGVPPEGDLPPGEPNPGDVPQPEDKKPVP